MNNGSNEKIDEEISNYFLNTGHTHVSVLINIDLPRPKFKLSARSPGEPLEVKTGRFNNVPDKHKIEKIVQFVKSELESKLDRTLIWIDSSGVFVAELSVDEISEICEMDFVKSVHFNRDHGQNKLVDEIAR